MAGYTVMGQEIFESMGETRPPMFSPIGGGLPQELSLPFGVIWAKT